MQAFFNSNTIKRHRIRLIKSRKPTEKSRPLMVNQYLPSRFISDSLALNSYNIELGFPDWFGQMVDFLSTRLIYKSSGNWHLQVLKAIPIGVDLDDLKLKNTIRIKILNDCLKNLEPLKEIDKEVNPEAHKVLTRLLRGIKKAIKLASEGESLSKVAHEGYLIMKRADKLEIKNPWGSENVWGKEAMILSTRALFYCNKRLDRFMALSANAKNSFTLDSYDRYAEFVLEAIKECYS